MLARALRAICAAALVTSVAACSGSSSPSASGPATGAATASASTSQVASDLPPLPASLDTGARPAATVRAAYEFAARHPEVLKYIPCFCGCERGGHTGNVDCFVSGRDAQGRVTDWSMHGLGCEICIDVATEARQMHEAGASVLDIRTTIDREYGAAGSHTPTPMPPKSGSKD